ncbi:MAG: hypothetical protein IMZ50_16530 [Candidatus Atribacteria bacterium]|nr:hypothetical protein [Candidatus Atribacteria bacterium]
MDIYLAAERAFHLVPQISLEVARDRLEQKKTSLVTGTLGALIARPKPEDIQIVSFESRLEAFWLINVFVRTVYERSHTYTISVSGAEVHHVTALGQDLPVTANPKSGASFSLNGVEHCVEERRQSFTFDGTGTKMDLSKYQSFEKSEIADLGQFAPAGVLVVPPQAHATTVVRAVLAEVIKPVQAQVIHEERVNVEALDINFRPVYAFEYEWVTKGKRVILEFDGLTGEVHSGGKKQNDQIKGYVTRDLIFDVTADAVGLIVPGGSIAVKLVKAVVDRRK